MIRPSTSTPVLLVVETEGAEGIAAEARARGWHPRFLRTDAYAGWLAPPDPDLKLEILYESKPDFLRLHEIACTGGASAVLPVSLLEPESERDALLRDLAMRRGDPFPVVASPPSGVELAFDKWLTKRVASAAGFEVVPGVLVESAAELAAAVERFGLPLVAKPRRDFTGKGFRIFREREEVEAYARRHHVRGLMVEPFLSGSELSLEVVRWRGEACAQPVVYKGETRLNTLEHPVYRPRLSPWRRGTALEAEVITAGLGIAALLGLEAACELEFIVVEGRPLLMEVNPRISGVTRLCNAGGGFDTFRLLARLAMGDTLRSPPTPGGVAVNLPITISAGDERVQRFAGHPALRHVKPIEWMPMLPIRASLLLQAPDLAGLHAAITEMEELTTAAYLDEMRASLAAHCVPL